MQPDFTTLSHWPPLSQNCWFYPPSGSPPYFAMPELHPDTMRSAGRYSEQMVHNPSGEKPATRMPHLGSYRGLSPSYPSPTSYLPSHSNSFYPARSPLHQDLLPSATEPFRLLERGTANSQYSSFNPALLERNTESSNEG